MSLSGRLSFCGDGCTRRDQRSDAYGPVCRSATSIREQCANDASGNHRHRRGDVGRLLDVEAAVTGALCHARAGANGLPDSLDMEN